VPDRHPQAVQGVELRVGPLRAEGDRRQWTL
jgi:hypothetical protein